MFESSKRGLVSIITPAWNAADFIADAITSVQEQSYCDWELLIVDDCSSDDTCKIIESFAEKDGRVRLIRQPRNYGPAAARNSALRQASGRWVAFLDSDDFWLPEKLEKQVAFHADCGGPLSFTAYRRISVDGQSLGHLILVPRWLNYWGLLKNTAIATSTVLIDRECTGDFEMQPTYYDDFVCWLRLLRSGGCAAGLNEDLMRYRVVKGSVSRNKWRSALEVWKTYRGVERLNLFRSMWVFCFYGLNAIRKYRRF